MHVTKPTEGLFVNAEDLGGRCRNPFILLLETSLVCKFPLLSKATTYQLGVSCLFLWCLPALCVKGQVQVSPGKLQEGCDSTHIYWNKPKLLAFLMGTCSTASLAQILAEARCGGMMPLDPGVISPPPHPVIAPSAQCQTGHHGVETNN